MLEAWETRGTPTSSAGGMVTWTIILTNKGPDAVQQAVVTTRDLAGDPPLAHVVLPPQCTGAPSDLIISCIAGMIVRSGRVQVVLTASGSFGGGSSELPVTFSLDSSTPTDLNPKTTPPRSSAGWAATSPFVAESPSCATMAPCATKESDDRSAFNQAKDVSGNIVQAGSIG